MRKRNRGRKFGRVKKQRKAFFKALVTALILNGKIKTTLARAKEISVLADKIITRAKNNNLASKRILAAFLAKRAVKKLIEEIAPKQKERKGGYTRIIKLGQRKSDGAEIAIIEIVQ